MTKKKLTKVNEDGGPYFFYFFFINFYLLYYELHLKLELHSPLRPLENPGCGSGIKNAGNSKRDCQTLLPYGLTFIATSEDALKTKKQKIKMEQSMFIF